MYPEKIDIASKTDHDADDDDSCTTLGESSEALLAPTPPPKEESSELLSPATQTLNTLSQSHLLNILDEKNDKTAPMALTSNKVSHPVTVSHCLPWKTRTERKKQEKLLLEQSLTPSIDLGLLTCSDCEETQESLETLPSTERLHELLSDENQEHLILLSSTASKECNPLTRKTNHGILPPAKQMPLRSLPDTNTEQLSSHRETNYHDVLLHSALLPTNSPLAQWTDIQEAQLQLYLQSLPVRMVTFHQPGPLGFTVLPRRLGRHNYCAVGESNTPMVRIGDLIRPSPCRQFLQYEELDVLRSMTERPLVIGMGKVPTWEDLNAAMSMIGPPVATTPQSPQPWTTTLHRLETFQATIPQPPDDLSQTTAAAAWQMNHNESITDIPPTGLEGTPKQRHIVSNNNDNDCPATFETSTILEKDVLQGAIPKLTTTRSSGNRNRSKKSIRWSELSQSDPEGFSSPKCSQSRDSNRTIKSNDAQVPLIDSKLTNTAIPKSKVSVHDMLKRPALFCNVCQNRNQSTRHHIRCPKSPCFRVEEFERMVSGYNKGCEACKAEYRDGRTRRKHTTCSRGNQVPDLTPEPKHDTPYCDACQTKNGPHHRLCPCHATFLTSGAAEQLKLILTGVEIGCRKCQDEYRTGKLTKRSHDIQCGRRRSAKRRENGDEPKVSNIQPYMSCRQLASDKVKDSNKPIQNSQMSVDGSDSDSDQPQVSPVIKRRQQQLQMSESESSDSDEAEELLEQYCQACQTLKGDHHVLCRHHYSFETSGSRQDLELLEAGVEVGCSRCQREYVTGEIHLSMRHSVECPRGRRRDRSNRSSPLNGMDSQTQESTHGDARVEAVNLKTVSNDVETHQSKQGTPYRRYSSRQKRQGFGLRANLTKKRKADSCSQKLTDRNISTSTSQQVPNTVEIPHLKVFIANQEIASMKFVPVMEDAIKGSKKGSTQSKERLPLTTTPSICIDNDASKRNSSFCKRNEGTDSWLEESSKGEEQERIVTAHDTMESRTLNSRGDKQHLPKTLGISRVGKERTQVLSQESMTFPIAARVYQTTIQDNLADCQQAESSIPVIEQAPDINEGIRIHPEEIDSQIAVVPTIGYDRTTNGHEESRRRRTLNSEERVEVVGQRKVNNLVSFETRDVVAPRMFNERKTKGREAKKLAETLPNGSESQGMACEMSLVAKEFASIEGHKTVDVKGFVSDSATVALKDGHTNDSLETNCVTREVKEKFMDAAVSIHDLVVPFCRACRDSSQMHHSLCPRHSLFSSSGALEKLERIRHGVGSDCAACIIQFERGSLGKNNVQHSFLCQRFETERRAKEERTATHEATVEGRTPREVRAIGGQQSGEKRGLSSSTKQSSTKRTNSKIVSPDEQDLETLGSKICKPTWTSCENPWGSMAYQEDDVVVSGDGGFTHHEVFATANRFVLDPFSGQSGYKETHFSPEEGTHVLKLTRDAIANIPWGCSVGRHDFGSACLVTAVDPNSPASQATFIGSTSHSPLCVNDMVLAVNGKDIGGMTEVGLEVEMEISGVELLLVVSRYRFPSLVDKLNADLERDTWTRLERNLDDKRILGWSELDLSSKRKGIDIDLDCVRRTTQSHHTYTTFHHSLSDNTTPLCEEDRPLSPSSLKEEAIDMESLHDKLSKSQNLDDHLPMMQGDSGNEMDDTSKAASLDSEDWEKDDNPWVGCVCGEIHDAPTVVFWIQCESCDTWCNVAPSCVGFDEHEAQFQRKWTCRACPCDG